MAKTIGKIAIGLILGAVGMYWYLTPCCQSNLTVTGTDTFRVYDSVTYPMPGQSVDDHEPTKFYYLQKFLTNSSNKVDSGSQQSSPSKNKFDQKFIKIDTGKILNQVDTAKILENADKTQDLLDYYRYKTYKNTLKDSNLQFNYKIGIFKNELDTFQSTYKLLRPTKTITNTLSQSSNALWANVNMDYTDIEAGFTYTWGKWGAGINFKVLTRRDLNTMERVELNLSRKLYEN